MRSPMTRNPFQLPKNTDCQVQVRDIDFSALKHFCYRWRKTKELVREARHVYELLVDGTLSLKREISRVRIFCTSLLTTNIMVGPSMNGKREFDLSPLAKLSRV